MSTTPERREEPNDDEVWEDLVSRLKENSDGALLGESDGLGNFPGPPGSTGFSRFDPLNVSRSDDSAHSDGPGTTPSPGAMAGPRDYSPPEEDEADFAFVPAEPASLATVEPAIALGWVGAVGAPIMLLLATIFWRNLPAAAIIGLVLIFVVAAGYLIYRLPGHRDHDDDGAQV